MAAGAGIYWAQNLLPERWVALWVVLIHKGLWMAGRGGHLRFEYGPGLLYDVQME